MAGDMSAVMVVRLPRNAAGGSKVIGLHKGARDVTDKSLEHWLSALNWDWVKKGYWCATGTIGGIPLSQLMSAEERRVMRLKAEAVEREQEKVRQQREAAGKERQRWKRAQKRHEEFDTIVRLALHNGPMKAADIARELAVSRSKVLRALYRLEDANWVRWNHRERWSCSGIIPRGHWGTNR